MTILDKIDLLRKNLILDSDKKLLSEIRREIKRTEKVNQQYGFFFDRVISDGENAERAAIDLKLL